MATYASNVVSGYTLKLELTEGTPDLANNTSPVTWKLTMSCTSQYTQSNGHSYSVSVNGSVVSSSANCMLNFSGMNTTITIAQGSATITHNADGTKSMPFSASFTGTGSYYSPSGAMSLSGNMALATIPRASSITLATTSVALNGSATQTVTITRASTSFTHTVEWLIGSTVMATQTGVATSQAIIPPQAAWLAKIPTSMSATATCRVTTFNGAAQIGSPVAATFTVTVPTTVKPAFTASVVRAANLTPDPGIYVQGFSGVTIGFTSPTPGTGATIKSWSITSADGNASADSATPGNLVIATLNTAGTRTFTLKLKDTRNQETTVTASIAVVNGVSTLAVGQASVPFGTDNTFTATRIATAMTHTITLALGTRTYTSTSFATTHSSALANAWADQIPATDKGTVTVTLKTYVGTTLIGQVAATYTVTVPSAAPFLPTVGTPTATRTGQTALTGYIEDNNGVNIAFTSGAAGTGATLTRWTITSDDGNTQGTGTSGSLSIPTLFTAGTRTFTVTVTDSRNRTVTQSISVTVAAYSPPSITAVSAFRSTSAGAADLSNGTYIRAQATVTFTATGGNALTRTVSWKKQGASATTGSQTFTSGTAATIGAGAITVVDNWVVTWTVTDTLGYSATTTILVQSGFRLIHAAPKVKSIAIGLVATLQNLLDIGLPTRIRQTLQVDGATTLAATTLGTVQAGAATLASLALSTPLGLANGGTGATTAAAARAALGVVPAFAPIIPANTDLNSYTTPGSYVQSANANATTALNYPVAQAGLLEVYKVDNGNGLWTFQRYTTYSSGATYVRCQYPNGTWLAWKAPGTDAAMLTTGTLPIARIANAAVTNAKLGSDIDASKLSTGTLPVARIADGTLAPAKLSALAVMNGNWMEEKLSGTVYRWTQITTVTTAVGSAWGNFFITPNKLAFPTLPSGATITAKSVSASLVSAGEAITTLIGTDGYWLARGSSVGSLAYQIVIVLYGTRN